MLSVRCRPFEGFGNEVLNCSHRCSVVANEEEGRQTGLRREAAFFSAMNDYSDSDTVPVSMIGMVSGGNSMREVVIDLAYYTMHKERSGAGLWGRESGLKAAKDNQLLKKAPTELILKIPNGICMGERFLTAFLGPLARKVGPENLKVTVIGGFEGGYADRAFRGDSDCWNTTQQIEEYLTLESMRVAKRQKEKAKVAQGPAWSPPLQFYVPEISTMLRLEGDWTFRLYCERRNHGFYSKLPGVFPGTEKWSWHSVNHGAERDVTIKAGALMSVSRVYIRQGGLEYSSLTFNLRKGAEVDVDGKVTVLKGGARFWAKLSDVNKMKVSIDTLTLAEN